MHHARLRVGCSKLNGDLYYNLYANVEPDCLCGYPLEDAEHYLVQCPLFATEREELTDFLLGICDVTCHSLLYGCDNLSLMQNRRIFSAVHKFIIDTKRFV